MKTNRFAILLPAFLAGCASVSVTKMKDAAPKAPDCKLEIFASESEVKRPYETLCLLSSRTGSAMFDDRSLNGALAELHPKACECGADGIIVMSGKSGGYNLLTGTEQGSAMVRAIRFSSK